MRTNVVFVVSGLIRQIDWPHDDCMSSLDYFRPRVGNWPSWAGHPLRKSRRMVLQVLQDGEIVF